MEEAVFLAAMYQIIRSIEVKDRLIGRLIMEGNDLIKQSLVKISGNLMVNPVLQATKCRLTTRYLFALDTALKGRIDS